VKIYDYVTIEKRVFTYNLNFETAPKTRIDHGALVLQSSRGLTVHFFSFTQEGDLVINLVVDNVAQIDGGMPFSEYIKDNQ